MNTRFGLSMSKAKISNSLTVSGITWPHSDKELAQFVRDYEAGNIPADVPCTTLLRGQYFIPPQADQPLTESFKSSTANFPCCHHLTLYLTQQGRQYAEQICERYQFFTARLVDAGVDRKTAEHDACNIEHAISAEAFQKLKSSLTNKEYRPF